MAHPLITVEGLGKRYHLTHEKRSDSLRDSLSQQFKGFLGRMVGAGRNPAQEEEFWALRDVSFQVNAGDVVGIVGRNGAGKSTLLKILSRITEPTTGRAVIRGRIASLLEVGTGFHPELSGRENIFLNGAILGMSRAEIARKFDEIVAFAEVERFLDTQVKHYSSGMYVRLAFAVAAHLEPEILVVDEVLAVGDADFQRKCLHKMDDVTRRQGRTILFVSHQLASVQQLCNRVIVLNRGQLTHDTTTAEGISAYLARRSEVTKPEATIRYGRELRLERVQFSPNPVNVFSDLHFDLSLQAQENCRIHDLCILVHNERRQRVAIADLRQPSRSYELVAGDTLRVEGMVRRLALVPGMYQVSFYVRTSLHAEDHQTVGSFEVVQEATAGLMSYPPEDLGIAALEFSFTPTVSRPPA
jgi:lipopolysaccharide transport system ATP-binding protein